MPNITVLACRPTYTFPITFRQETGGGSEWIPAAQLSALRLVRALAPTLTSKQLGLVLGEDDAHSLVRLSRCNPLSNGQQLRLTEAGGSSCFRVGAGYLSGAFVEPEDIVSHLNSIRWLVVSTVRLCTVQTFFRAGNIIVSLLYLVFHTYRGISTPGLVTLGGQSSFFDTKRPWILQHRMVAFNGNDKHQTLFDILPCLCSV